MLTHCAVYRVGAGLLLPQHALDPSSTAGSRPAAAIVRLGWAVHPLQLLLEKEPPHRLRLLAPIPAFPGPLVHPALLGVGDVEVDRRGERAGVA